jgi:ABC-type transport system involved in multi-copper enzyme maturation permease subunit
METPLLRDILFIARHELAVAVRTKRALAVAALYLGGAVIGGFAYVRALKFVEESALKMLLDKGANPLAAAGTVSIVTDKAYTQMLSFFTGVASDRISSSLRDSLTLPAVLWGSLAFLPLVLILTSYDQIASDVASRSLCYTVLRVPRRAVVLGKLAAHAVVSCVLVLAAGGVMIGLGQALLSSADWGDTLLGLGRVWLLLIPYALCYLGLSALGSSLARQPGTALFDCFGLMVLLRLAGALDSIPESHALAFLRHLHWLSPAGYQSGMWEAGLLAPLSSAAAYLLFAMAFVWLAVKRLEARDL